MLTANPTDLSDLLALERACFSEDAFNPRQFRHLLHSPTATILLHKVNQQLAGMLILLFRKHCNHARIYSIAVHPNFRNQGIGQTLMQRAEQTTRARGLNRIQLEVRKSNTQAQLLYQKNGYSTISNKDNYYPNGESAIVFQKNL